jgi:hypothetical protein
MSAEKEVEVKVEEIEISDSVSSCDSVDSLPSLKKSSSEIGKFSLI